MVAISQLWYNGSYTIAAKPIKTLESHYTMIQFLIIEITPRNSISVLGFAANDIHMFSIDHKIKLNPTKCKEMTINFMTNHNLICSPIIIGTNTIQNVSSYKLLGVIISSDLSWNRHVEYVTKKTNKRLVS